MPVGDGCEQEELGESGEETVKNDDILPIEKPKCLSNINAVGNMQERQVATNRRE
jgi:hypothetical protein